MARHNAAQASSLSSLPQLDMYETTVSGRDSTEAAYLQLRRAILRNELPSGKHLSQRELEQRFGVGRTPLREALRMLQREGLVEAEPNHRVRVASFSFSDLEQLYATRINLEALAIRLTVPCLQTADLDRLEGFFTRMEELGTLEAYEQWEVPHRAFHLGLVAYAG
ncbi:MAG TPA: GntR family transcriptional regulator, partial [Ktedonobacteraceae bacterium]|nr:GntR family transcriptional regulator [Ktedonobacteraceae bacterium]